MKTPVLFAVILLLPLCACKKNFENINKDPVGIEGGQYDPNFLLSAAQLNYTGSPYGGSDAAHTELGGCAAFIQHLASTETTEFYGDKYFANINATGIYFEVAYTQQVKLAVDLMALTKDRPASKNLYQAGRLMRAMMLERITDLYGDVPYFEAGLGYYDKAYYPKYDSQQAIYTDLLKEVAEATAALDPAGDRFSADLYYHDRDDQVDAWKRFGNTLLLRMAMRLTKRDPETAKRYVLQVTGHTMQSNDDNAIVQHDASGQQLSENRVSLIFIEPSIRYEAKLSKTFVDFLQSNDDPRLPVLAEIPMDGSHDAAAQLGLPNGYNSDRNSAFGIQNHVDYPDTMAKYSQPSALIVDLNAPTFVLTYAESELLLADAAARWGTGNAEEHYHHGVVAAITQLKAYGDAGVITTADAEAYYTSHPYDPAKGLEMINTQFWATTLFNDYEAWFNWRRTGYPALTPVQYAGNATQGTIPRRLPYAVSEASSNNANYEAAKNSVPGGDKFTSRVWWDL